MNSKSAFVITTFSVGVMIFFGCSKKPQVKYQFDSASVTPSTEVLLNQRINSLEKELALKDQKLKSLGLLDPDGSLREIKEPHKEIVSGAESWQK